MRLFVQAGAADGQIIIVHGLAADGHALALPDEGGHGVHGQRREGKKLW